jgi:hypothetical protein
MWMYILHTSEFSEMSDELTGIHIKSIHDISAGQVQDAIRELLPIC